jgi:hypothetical protein
MSPDLTTPDFPRRRDSFPDTLGKKPAAIERALDLKSGS